MPAEFSWPAYAALCAALGLWFTAIWAWAKFRDNWSLVDAAWAATPPLFAAWPVFATGAPTPRSLVFFALLTCWGLRLALHLHARVGGGREREDARYAAMRQAWGDGLARRMFWFYQIQAGTVAVLILPAMLVGGDASAYPGWHDLVAAALALVGIGGEAVADAQLKRFRADPANRGRICETGLWAWSRHPNYFFEWVAWLGFGLAACRAASGPWSLLAPLLMYALVRHGSGVPISEERAARLKGEAWRDYARRVPVFFPRRPRR